MKDLETLMAKAQIALTIMLLTFTFTLLLIYELGLARLSADQLKDFARSVDWLEGASLIAVYFWFQRARTSGIPDPASQVVTQERILPDGTKTTVTSPAATTAVVAGTSVQKTGAIVNAKPITTNPADSTHTP